MCGASFNGTNTRISAADLFDAGDRLARQLDVTRPQRDAYELGVVTEVPGQKRQERWVVVIAKRLQPAVCRLGVAFRHRLESEQPAGVAADFGSAGSYCGAGEPHFVPSLGAVVRVKGNPSECQQPRCFRCDPGKQN